MRKSLSVLLGAAWTLAGFGAAGAEADPQGLAPVTTFAAIQDPAARSAALFVEAGKVLQHPRCVNCHPAGDQPLQGAGQPHQPEVWRGIGGNGVVGMRCSTCHQSENFDPGRIPGAPHWLLAPRQAAWESKTLAEICAQLKDPQRNGGRELAEIVTHMAEDPLVGWAWQPGIAREPPPGTQADLAALIREWVATGAVCPSPP